MSHNFEAYGKYPNLGPNSHNWFHQYFNPGIKPAAVRSSAYAAAFDVPSELLSQTLSIINIKGIIAIAKTAIATGSPCAVPSADTISMQPITNKRDGLE